MQSNSMIELRPLRQFVAVAEELHFGRAARRLAMTQPPLTQAVQGLERTLGARLFERTRRTVALTPAGHALLEEARRLLRAAEVLPLAVQAAALGRAGRLRLAFVSSIAYAALPLWLRAFREAYPGVQLQLREATLDVQLLAFAADDIDAGFVLHAPGAAPPGFAALTVLSEAMWLALPEGHVAGARATVHERDIADAPLLIFPRAVTPSLYDAILAGQRDRGLTPRVAQEAIQMQTLVSLVSAGIGIAWVPESVTRLQRPGVIYRRLAGAPVMAETSLIWRAPAGPVVQRFIDEVRAQIDTQTRPRAQRRQSRSV
jgi:DNA-binding transcriptional LysR family regulator